MRFCYLKLGIVTLFLSTLRLTFLELKYIGATHLVIGRSGLQQTSLAHTLE